MSVTKLPIVQAFFISTNYHKANNIIIIVCTRFADLANVYTLVCYCGYNTDKNRNSERQGYRENVLGMQS